MALSNWDMLLIGTDGKACSEPGKFEFIEVEIYKNSAYVKSQVLWRPEMGSSQPIICSFLEGDINLAGVQIVGKRGPQSSIFLYAGDSGKWEQKEVNGEVKWDQVIPSRYFSGIGCYGFGNLTEQYLKSKGVVLPAPWEDLFEYTTWRDGKEYIGYSWEGKEVLIEVDEGVDLNPWVGVTKETIEEFKAWLKEVADEEYFKTIDWDNLVRFNQGDAYICAASDLDVPATAIGDAEKPILIQALQSLKTEE